jgi:RNA polymerase sigma-70 factor (ECF subfamily)
MVDATVSNTVECKLVRVRVPPSAPCKTNAAIGEAILNERLAGEPPVADSSTAEGRRADELGQGMDVALVEQALEGKLDAFNQLVVRHQDHLFALVYRLVPDRDQAADAVQEAFFNAYRNLAAFRGGSVRSWLGRIAVNAAMDIQRSRRRRPSSPYPELEDESWQPPALESEEPEARTLEIERSRALAVALQALPFDQRNCIVLFDVDGYDYSEIAEIMGVSVGTVKSRIHRGRLALRTALAPVRELFRG